MRLPQQLTPHTVKYRKVKGSNSSGKVYGPYVELEDVQVVDKRKLVRSGGGSEIVSESQVYVNLGDAELEEGDLVTIWGGTYREREAKIESISTWDARHQAIPAYLEVFLL